MSLFLLPFVPNVQATDYYVRADGGSDAQTGLDWDHAKASIGAAMALADGGDNIHVAKGVYSEKITFPGADDMRLLGGYSGRTGSAP